MPNLSRKVGEKIIIGGNIVIYVAEVKNGHVRLGIDAPPDVTIHREEIQKIIDQQGGW